MTFPIVVALLGTLPAIVALLLARRDGTKPETRSIPAYTTGTPLRRDVHCTIGCATTTVRLSIDARGATCTDAASAVEQVTLQAGHAMEQSFGVVVRMRARVRSLDRRGDRSAS